MLCTNNAGLRAHVPYSFNMPALRASIVGIAVGITVIASAAIEPVHALEYDFVSVHSRVGGLAPTSPTASVNGTGTTAFIAVVHNAVSNRDEHVLFRGSGAEPTAVLNVTEAFGEGTPGSPVINESDAIALTHTSATETVIVRVGADGTVSVLARASVLSGTPYRAIAPGVSLNDAGQVAALVTNVDSTTSIVRFDESGALEIARSGSDFADFSPPTLNNAGVVAVTARAIASGAVGVYTGSGGAVSAEGAVDACAATSESAPVITNDGFVLSDCAPVLFRARAGVVTVVVSPATDAAFGRLLQGYSANGHGVPAFVAGRTDVASELGLFVGNDPVRDTVLRTGDALFGGAVQDVRVGPHAMNDAGQIVLLAQVAAGGTVISQVVLATPRRLSQTIAFDPVADRSFGSPAFAVTATASSGLAVGLSVDGPCAIADATVSLRGAGVCTITAVQRGDAIYLPAADVVQTFTIGRAAQTITVAPLADVIFGAPAIAISAVASSGLPVTLSSAGACSVAGTLVTLAGAGSCTVTAFQSGNADYEPAPAVGRTFTIARAGQTISLTAPTNGTFGDAPVTVIATASSGLPVDLVTAGSCTIAASTLTLTGGGPCTVTASQGGNADYEAAPEVSRSVAVARAAQTITFGPLPARAFGDPPFTVTATASSGLAVALRVSGNCLGNGDVVTITGAGACAIAASQPGDANYLPAREVTQTVAIARATQTISFGPLASRRLADPPFAVSATASSGLTVAFAASGPCSVEGGMVSVTGAGVCTITASQGGGGNFDPAPPVSRAFQISGVILEAHFEGGPETFTYVDDPFRNSDQAGYASGAWTAAGGYRGGALRINLGGIDNRTVSGMSGGWQTTFALSAPTRVVLYLRANLTQSPYYEADEKSELLVSVDGALTGVAPNDFLAQLVGDGNTGTSLTTGWRLYAVSLGTLAAGTHTLVIGGYNSKKTEVSESTTLVIDDVLLTEAGAGAQTAVASLDFERFKENIRILASYGDRTQGSPSYANAAAWLQSQLQAAGYTVQQHPYTYQSQPRTSLYVTKVGTVFPDHMYIVSAHLDGRGGGGAANDDASGCALVLEAARALAPLQTAVSVRFIFWNNEETGLNGSTAYVNTRAALQGVETPIGSGLYPEPRWLGMIQHDQILFDHGLPPQPAQIPSADIDVEYQASSAFAAQSLQLANALRAGNQTYSANYPAQVGSNMNYTDSVPFQNYTAAVSVRDNQRVAEIGNGSNPHWHQPTDVYTAFSEQDFRLGFNAVQMTLGTVAELAGATTP